MKLQYKCAACNKSFDSQQKLSSHYNREHHLSGKEYYDLYLKKPDEGLCKREGCNNPAKFWNNTIGYMNYCSKECRYADIKPRERKGKKYLQRENVKKNGKFECKICGNHTDCLGSHIIQVHHITCKEYYDTYLKKEGEGICANPDCNNETTFLGIGIKKYGYSRYCSCYCVQNDQKVKDKKVETSLRLHGVEHYRNGEQARKTFLSNRTEEELEEFYKKSIETRDNVSDKVKEERIKKARKTREERYGKGAWISDETIEQTKQTKKDRYGNENYNNREQATNTYMDKYGQSFPIQHKYTYDGRFFDSSWEIAYYIWLKDHNIPFEFHPSIKDTKLYYTWNCKERPYYVDFIVNGEYVEIKNDILYKKMLIENTQEHAKLQLMEEKHVIIMRNKDISPYLRYIALKYGKDYLKQFITANIKIKKL